MPRIGRSFYFRIAILILLSGCHVYPVTPYRPDVVRVIADIEDSHRPRQVRFEVEWSP